MTDAPSTEAAATPTESRFSAAGRATYELALRLGGLFVAIILVGIVFETLNHAFLNTDVIISLLRSMSSVAIMALGLTLVVVGGEIDLSVGAMYGLAANSLAVLWILNGVSVYLAIPLAITVGALVGLFNGVLVTFAKIPAFVVTLGSYNLLYGISLYISHAGTFNPVYPPEGIEIDPGQLKFFQALTEQFGAHKISIEVLWMALFALVVGFLLHRSLFGFRLMAIGGNPIAGRLARLPVRRYKIIAFVLAGMLSAAAGTLDFSFIQTAQPDLGLSSTFPVFAAVIIGGASLAGGKGTIIGTIGGAMLLAELQTGLALLTLGPHAQQLFLGFVTIGAVALDIVLTKLRARNNA